MLRNFERRILRIIFGPVNDNAIWRTRWHSEIYTVHNEPDKGKLAKIGRLRWLGHPFKIEGLDPCRKLRKLSTYTRRQLDE
jgi:hypothetical protein